MRRQEVCACRAQARAEEQSARRRRRSRGALVSLVCFVVLIGAGWSLVGAALAAFAAGAVASQIGATR